MPTRSNPVVKKTTSRPGGERLPLPLAGPLVTGPAHYSGTVTVRLAGVTPGATVQARFFETTSGKRSKVGQIIERLGTDGDSFIDVTNAGGHCDKDATLGVEYAVFGDEGTHDLVSGQAQILYWK